MMVQHAGLAAFPAYGQTPKACFSLQQCKAWLLNLNSCIPNLNSCFENLNLCTADLNSCTANSRLRPVRKFAIRRYILHIPPRLALP